VVALAMSDRWGQNGVSLSWTQHKAQAERHEVASARLQECSPGCVHVVSSCGRYDAHLRAVNRETLTSLSVSMPTVVWTAGGG
jgi:hypothetical protein